MTNSHPLSIRCSAMSDAVARPTILILGRIGVAIVGGAGVLVSALGLVTGLTDAEAGRGWILDAIVFVAFLVGTVAGAMGRARGATLVAAIYGALGLLLVWFSIGSPAPIQPLTILLWAASIFVLAVAVALRRAETKRRTG